MPLISQDRNKLEDNIYSGCIRAIVSQFAQMLALLLILIKSLFCMIMQIIGGSPNDDIKNR